MADPAPPPAEPPAPPPGAPRAVLKHLRASRWMHWVNFPLLVVMVWSGLLIYWAHDPYRIGWGDWTLLKFFPDGFYEVLDLDRKLARGMAYHFAFGWLFALNGVAYVLYTVISGEWRHLVPDRRDFRDAWGVVLHDLRIRKTAPPQGRYNAAQRITYTGVVVMGAGAVLTGLAIYKPTQLAWLTALFFGYEGARMIHFILTIGFALFFVIHIAQVVRAGWRNFMSMVTGYELITPETPAPSEPAPPPSDSVFEPVSLDSAAPSRPDTPDA